MIKAHIVYNFESQEYRDLYGYEDEDENGSYGSDGVSGEGIENEWTEITDDDIEEEPGVWVSAICSYTTELPYIPRVGDVMRVMGLEVPVKQVIWDQETELVEIKMQEQQIEEARYMALKPKMEEAGWWVGELWRLTEVEEQEDIA